MPTLSVLTNILVFFLKTGSWEFVPEEGHATLWWWSFCWGISRIVQCILSFQVSLLLCHSISMFNRSSSLCIMTFPVSHHFISLYIIKLFVYYVHLLEAFWDWLGHRITNCIRRIVSPFTFCCSLLTYSFTLPILLVLVGRNAWYRQSQQQVFS